eukprot:m.450741 g.450741  ORF g.450741 m.450741 type:complete len:494 (+) comp21517_c0_seq1:823-2304(+)
MLEGVIPARLALGVNAAIQDPDNGKDIGLSGNSSASNVATRTETNSVQKATDTAATNNDSDAMNTSTSPVPHSEPDVEDHDQRDTLRKPRSCYICKNRFRQLHHFYDQLCPTCATLNYTKRTQIVDLTGYYFLVTGARVKIGFRGALKLLRCGATVIATTRFPADALARYRKESDAANWLHRLHVYGIDLKSIAVVESFTQFLKLTYPYLDGIVNNACQTIRRPPQYYRHLLDNEIEWKRAMALTGETSDDGTASQGAATGGALSSCTHAVVDGTHPTVQWHRQQGFQHSVARGAHAAPSDEHTVVPTSAAMTAAAATSTDAVNTLSSFEVSQVATIVNDTDNDEQHFPDNALDVNGQQIDLRKTNSWLLTLGQIETPELCEVLTVNSVAPFVLNGKLRSHLTKSPHKARFIVNVSAMEGKFYRYSSIAMVQVGEISLCMCYTSFGTRIILLPPIRHSRIQRCLFRIIARSSFSRPYNRSTVRSTCVRAWCFK